MSLEISIEFPFEKIKSKIPIDQTNSTFGAISKDGTLFWIIDDSHLQVFDSEKGNYISTFDFEDKITSCVEIQMDQDKKETQLLVCSGKRVFILDKRFSSIIRSFIFPKRTIQALQLKLDKKVKLFEGFQVPSLLIFEQGHIVLLELSKTSQNLKKVTQW